MQFVKVMRCHLPPRNHFLCHIIQMSIGNRINCCQYINQNERLVSCLLTHMISWLPLEVAVSHLKRHQISLHNSTITSTLIYAIIEKSHQQIIIVQLASSYISHTDIDVIISTKIAQLQLATLLGSLVCIWLLILLQLAKQLTNITWHL